MSLFHLEKSLAPIASLTLVRFEHEPPHALMLGRVETPSYQRVRARSSSGVDMANAFAAKSMVTSAVACGPARTTEARPAASVS
jgi:hypothetical protein